MMNKKQQLLEFYNDGLKDCSWIPDTPKEFLAFCELSNVIVSHGVIVIEVHNSNFLYIDTIYTLKAVRCQQRATKMMARITKSRRGCVVCNKQLVGQYEKLGFKQDKDLPFAVMIKEKA